MARLLSVNVGLPRDIAWNGRTVHTAIYKDSVAGPRRAGRLNLDGDGQGDLSGHGGEQRAVYVYQIESYRHWQKALQRTDFRHGQFGENFTTEGLADDTVCIGDRYRIGGALFEVTQPRVTCYRLGIRMNEPRMAALLTSSGRPGFYMRVLREGEVAAGDEIVKVAEATERMTVAEINALLYSPRHPRDRLESALRIDALSPGWRASFEALLHNAGAVSTGNAGLMPSAAAHPAAPGFRPLAVTTVDRESADVLSLTMRSRDDHPLRTPLPGQYVVLRLQLPTPLFRSYSLSGPPSTERYRISVKIEPNGTAGIYLRDRIRVGDAIDVSAPRGTFTLQPGGRPVVLISAGIGATPVLAMLHALAGTRSARDVWWLHGARNRAEEPFAEESRSLLAGLTRGHRHICYSRPGPGDAEGRDYQTEGRISASVLVALDLPRDADAYICGPAPFMADVSAALAGMGIGRVHTEVFGAAPGLTPGITAGATRPPHLPPGEPGAGPQVACARSGLTAPWDPRYASLLDLAEACDVPVRWACRTGVCHTCETNLMSGAVSYAPDPVDDPADGSALICCSSPTADLVLDL